MRLFHERELILRSDGKVRFFRIGTFAQLATATAVTGLLTWTAVTSLSSWVQYEIIQEKNLEIAEAKLSYDGVHDELVQFQSDLSDLTGRLSLKLSTEEAQGEMDSQAPAPAQTIRADLAKFNQLGREIGLALNRLTIDFDIPATERNQIIASRERLHEKIRELEVMLNQSEDRIAGLSSEVSRQRTEVRAVEDDRQRLEERRDKLVARVGELEKSLNQSNDSGIVLSTKVGSLSHQLQQSRQQASQLEVERTALRQELERLELSLDSSEEEHDIAERRLASLAKQLASAAGLSAPGDLRTAVPGTDQAQSRYATLAALEAQATRVMSDLRSTRETASQVDKTLSSVLAGLKRVAGYERASAQLDDTKRHEHALALMEEIEGLHKVQFELVDRLQSQTTASITNAENVIASTGLDVERMVKLAGFARGQGGPLIEADLVGGTATDLANGVAALESQVARLEVVNEVLACIPLIPPVDYYHLTSKFGKRKDPFTGKRAMHKGVDLAGWPGTSVWAAAPGTVVKAGTSGRYGRMVEIDHGCGIRTRYGHLQKILVKKGQELPHRHKVGKLGNTGRSTGPHVHYEILIEGQPVDPMKFIEAGRHVFKG